MKVSKVTITFIALCALSLIGCNNNNQTKAIKVGAVIPLSGEVATYGESLKKGFDLALSEENGKFVIVYEDSKADKNTGISAINKLISVDNVKFVFSDATSGVTLAIAPVAEKNKVILFDAIATSDEIIRSGDYVFRNAPSNYKQAIKAAAFIIGDLKVKDIAIIFNQTDYGVNLSEKFRSELKTQNLTAIFEAGYQDGMTDFKTILTKLKSSNANAVFVPGNYEETANMLKQARQMGINIPFVGTDGAYSPKLIEIAGNATNNFYLTMMGVDVNNEMYKNFVSNFKVRYHSAPDVFSTYGYEAAIILFQSILKSGNDADKVKQYLYSNTFNCFSGQLKFDGDGEVSRDYVVLKVGDGKFIN